MSSTSMLIWRRKLFTSFRVIMLSPFLSAFRMQLMIQLWLRCKANFLYVFFFFFTLITLVLFRVLIFRCFCNTNPSYFLSIFLKGYCSLICCELRLRMLVMTFSSPITHLLASSLLLAIRSRFLRLPLKMMEKQWSSTVPSVYFCRPSDWRPWRTDSMSLMETVEKTTEL